MKRIIVLFFIVVFFSCTNELNELREIIDSTIIDLESKLVNVKKSCDVGAKIVSENFKNMNYSKTEVSSIDKENGGSYYWFEDFLYIRDYEFEKERGWQVRYYNMGILPLEEEFTLENLRNKTFKIKDAPEPLSHEAMSTIVLLESIGKKIKDIHDNYIGDVYGATYCMLPRYYTDFYTTIYDSASVFPTTLTREDFNNAEWFNMGTPIGNPLLEDKWTKDVFIEFTNNQWLITYMKNIKINNNYLGSYQVSFKTDIFGDKIISNLDHNVMLLSKSLRVLSLSNKLNDLKIFKIEDDYDFLTQMKTNPKFLDEFILSHETQKDDIKELARHISDGKKEVNIRLNGDNYTAIIQQTKEVGFYIVGFLKI